jgi:hypothetical protein
MHSTIVSCVKISAHLGVGCDVNIFFSASTMF